MAETTEGNGKTGNSTLIGVRAWFLLFLAAVGVPVITGAALWNWASHHAIPAHILLTLYELLVLLARLAILIWSKAESEIVDWLYLRVLWLFSRYYRQYCRYLLNRDSYMDMKGVGVQGAYALKLEEVFVELSIMPKVPEQANPNPVAQPPDQQKSAPSARLPDTPPQGRHPIWEYLRGDAHLAILGAPGSGKTTLLYHVAQTLLQPKKRRNLQGPPKLPILLFLRNHWEGIAANSDRSLSELTDA